MLEKYYCGIRKFVFSYGIVLSVILIATSCAEDDGLAKKYSSITQKELNKKENFDANFIESDKNIIYLTFDDGPNSGTENVLRILREKKVYATSFVIGSHVYGSKKQNETWESMRNDTLIEIANHSYHHAYNKYANYYKKPEVVIEDFNKAKDSLKLTSFIARTPGRNIWRITPELSVTDIEASKEAADQLHQAGYTLVGWDLEWHSNKEMKLKYSHKTMIEKLNSMFQNQLEKTSKHMVVLMHDQFFQDEDSIEELDKFIDELLKSEQYEFRKISDYPNIKSVRNQYQLKL